MSLKDFSPRVGIIVQARLGSTRLPGKVLLDLVEGHSVLSYLLRRLSSCKRVDCLVVAIPDNVDNDELASLISSSGYRLFRGDETDCLDRYYRAAIANSLEVIVRITSDCPFVVPENVDQMITYYLEHYSEIDYLSNREFTDFPEGLDVEIFNVDALRRAAQEAKDPAEREHINFYFLRHPELFRVRYFRHELGADYSRFQLSIDTDKDLEQARGLFKEGGLPFDFSFEQLMSVLAENELEGRL